MNVESVIGVLDILERADVDALIDGGWGVDALLGEQTRAHDDLDLVVRLEDVARIQEALGSEGFVLVEDHLPVRIVLAHPLLGRVDLHTVTLDAEGGRIHPQPNGTTFRYPPEGFVIGSIAERTVPCVSAEVQVLCHMGYEPKDKDVHDLTALRRAFGVALPEPYRSRENTG